MGNDISYYKRNVKAFQPIFYSTNAGNLMAFQNGEEFNSKEKAYENTSKNQKINQNNWSRTLASKTVISTFAWVVWKKINMTSNGIVIKEKHNKPSCNQEIKDIITYSQKYNSRFKLVVIPDFLTNKTKIEDFPYLFENIDYSYSPILETGYKKSDGHFNVKGHKEYAEFLDELIHQTFSKSDTLN